MPIEFPCPTCHQQVRTPDAAAGKKGKCPSCGAIVLIPAMPTVLQPPVPVKPAEPPKPKPEPPPPTAGAIEFSCPHCHHTVRTPASAAGKKGMCPHCQKVVDIPLRSQKRLHGDPKPQPPATAAPAGSQSAPQPPAAPAAPKPAAAKRPASPTPIPVAKPLPKPTPKPAPASRPSDDDDIPTLNPTDSGSGLTPLADPFGGLTPLDDPYNLAPLSQAPAFQDPLAGLPPANPLGIPARPANYGSSPFGPAPNPYPSPSPYAPQSYGAQSYGTQSGYGYRPQRPNNLATSALVCGILGILAGLCCPLVGFPLNIAAISMGLMSMRQPNMGQAIGGLVCGIIGLLITIANAALGVMLQMHSMQQNRFQSPYGP